MAIPFQPEQLSRWRLVLGKDSQECLSQLGSGCSLSAEQMAHIRHAAPQELDRWTKSVLSAKTLDEVLRV